MTLLHNTGKMVKQIMAYQEGESHQITTVYKI